MTTVTITSGVASSDNCEWEDQDRIEKLVLSQCEFLYSFSDGTYEVSLPPAVKVEQFQFNAGTWINRPKEDQFAPRSTKIRYRTVWRFVAEKFEPIIIHDPLVGSHESQEKLWESAHAKMWLLWDRPTNEIISAMTKHFTISRKT